MEKHVEIKTTSAQKFDIPARQSRGFDFPGGSWREPQEASGGTAVYCWFGVLCSNGSSHFSIGLFLSTCLIGNDQQLFTCASVW